MSDSNFKKDTRFIHGSFQHENETGATNVPVYLSAGFEHETAQELSDVFHGRDFGYVYSRIANPSVVAFEQHVTAIESARASVATSSGMAAIAILIDALASSGDHIVSSKSIFGGTYYLLKEVSDHQGISVSYVDSCDLDQYRHAIGPTTKAIFCESIGNPKCDVPDLKALADIANQAGIPLVVDGTVSTSYLLDARANGVHIVWHSATKWISGSGSVVGGVIVDTGLFDWKQSKSSAIASLSDSFSSLAFVQRCKRLRSNKGSVLSPFHAFLLQQGFAHLPLRMQRHCDNARVVAQALDAHDEVVSVSYPGLDRHADYHVAEKQFDGKGFGSLLSFRLKNKEAAFRVIDRLTLVKQLANIGDAKTLVIHPASTIYRELDTHQQAEAGVYDDLLRVSVGLEDVQDIVADFVQAMEVS